MRDCARYSNMSKLDFFQNNISDIDLFMEKHAAYKNLKSAELDGIPENEIVTAVTSWIEGKFSEDWSDMCEVINRLPTPCLNVYCADYTAKEILGGGFAQAFFNSSRDFVGAAANGFRAVGYPEAAEVIEKALKIHYDSGNTVSAGTAEMGRGIEDFLSFGAGGEYDDCDREFRADFDSEKFGGLVYGYVMRYRKYFGNQTGEE